MSCKASCLHKLCLRPEDSPNPINPMTDAELTHLAAEILSDFQENDRQHSLLFTTGSHDDNKSVEISAEIVYHDRYQSRCHLHPLQESPYSSPPLTAQPHIQSVPPLIQTDSDCLSNSPLPTLPSPGTVTTTVTFQPRPQLTQFPKPQLTHSHRPFNFQDDPPLDVPILHNDHHDAHRRVGGVSQSAVTVGTGNKVRGVKRFTQRERSKSRAKEEAPDQSLCNEMLYPPSVMASNITNHSSALNGVLKLQQTPLDSPTPPPIGLSVPRTVSPDHFKHISADSPFIKHAISTDSSVTNQTPEYSNRSNVSRPSQCSHPSHPSHRGAVHSIARTPVLSIDSNSMNTERSFDVDPVVPILVDVAAVNPQSAKIPDFRSTDSQRTELTDMMAAEVKSTTTTPPNSEIPSKFNAHSRLTPVGQPQMNMGMNRRRQAVHEPIHRMKPLEDDNPLKSKSVQIGSVSKGNGNVPLTRRGNPFRSRCPRPHSGGRSSGKTRAMMNPLIPYSYFDGLDDSLEITSNSSNTSNPANSKLIHSPLQSSLEMLDDSDDEPTFLLDDSKNICFEFAFNDSQKTRFLDPGSAAKGWASTGNTSKSTRSSNFRSGSSRMGTRPHPPGL